FTGLDIANGPDLRVYLVAGPVADDSDVSEFVDLGRLKGNKGTQQYSIPTGTDTARYATVVIWCRAFTVGFAKAALGAS
ncbi:MAG: DM13 domain-containing protein, partial [Gaiellaceae bacterium]